MSLQEDNAPDPEPFLAEKARLDAFTATHWSLVMKAGQDDPAVAGVAMERLCQVYWFPIYNFICRQYRCNHHDAQDLTQGFFAHLVEKATISRADRDKGKFRTFLLGALKYFRANERDHVLAQKRGGNCEFLSLDEINAPHAPSPSPLDADKAFNQDWAFALVEQARERLKEKYAREDKALLFATMEPALLREDAKDLYAPWAATLEMSQEAVEVAFHRLRRRFGKALRLEVARTVSNPADAREELRSLLAAIAD